MKVCRSRDGLLVAALLQLSEAGRRCTPRWLRRQNKEMGSDLRPRSIECSRPGPYGWSPWARSPSGPLVPAWGKVELREKEILSPTKLIRLASPKPVARGGAGAQAGADRPAAINTLQRSTKTSSGVASKLALIRTTATSNA